MSSHQWIKVYSDPQPHKVEIVRAELWENNIESVIIDKRDRSYPTLGELELYVKPGDDILAALIIENIENKL